MKAVLVTAAGGPETMQYTDIAAPEIQAHQVLIRVVSTSVNYADIKARHGKKDAVFPFIPGLDAAGVVEQVGAAVRSLRLGQRVIAFPKHGSYAEFVAADEALTFALPDGVDWDMAAACPTVSILSYKLLTDLGRLAPGETVLVHAAAGGVGTTAIQLAKLLGAGRVIGAVGSDSKKVVALGAGADYAVNYEQDDFAAKVNEWTSGAGADIILDSVSGAVSEQSLSCLAPYGRLLHFGNSGGRIGHIPTVELHANCRSVIGFSLGTTRSKRPELLREPAQKVLALLAAKRLQLNIGGRFPLAHAAEAQALVESRRSTGKILLEVSKP